MKSNNNLISSMIDKCSVYVQLEDIKRKLIPIYSFSLLFFILIFIFGPSPSSGDTNSNFSAGSILASGKLDAVRTPLYPLILNFFKFTLRNNFALKFGIIIFQYLIFCISIYCFYRVCEYFIKHKGIAFFVVMYYACHPAILVWHKIIMTESLALSGIIFWIYFIVKFLMTKETVYSLFINLFLFLLVMLRPGFIFLVPIGMFFWLFSILKRVKKGWIGLGLNIFVILIITIYSLNFKNQFGVFSISTVSDINQYMILRDAGLIDTNKIENLKIKNTLNEYIQKKKTISEYYDEYIYLYTQFGYPLSHKFIQESVKGDFPKYMTYNIKRFINQTTDSKIGYWNSFSYNKYYPLIKHICFSFILLYIFLIFYFIILIKNKLHTKPSIFIYSIAISSILIFIIGSPDAWGRLVVPTIPILLIMIGQSLNYLRLKIIVVR